MKNGFVIAKTTSSKQFFTSKSAYNRPEWVGLTEARVYYSADLAERARTSLVAAGSYGASVIPLSELVDPNLGDNHMDQQSMTADKQGDVCPDCHHEPCTCDDSQESPNGDDDTDSLDPSEIDPSDNADIDRQQPLASTELSSDRDANNGDDDTDLTSADTTPGGDIDTTDVDDIATPDRNMTPGTEVTYEERPYVIVKKADDGLVLQSLDNPSSSPIKVDPSQLQIKESVVFAMKQPSYINTGSQEAMGADEDKFSVPSSVTSALSKELNAQVKLTKNNTNPDDVSFRITVAAAMEDMLALFKEGTTMSFKRAQVLFSSLMSPIQYLFPSEVRQFLMTGGQKSSLNDLFYKFKK